MLFAVVYFVLPLILTAVALLAAVRLFPRWGLVDRPVATSMHQRPMPTMAGVVMGGIFFLFAGFGAYIVPLNGLAPGGYALLLFWLAVFLTVGIIDDLIRIPSYFKMAPYLVIAVAIAWSGFRLRALPLPWLGETPLVFPWDYLVTVLWFIAVINAINIVDGLDGLLGMFSFIYFLGFALICLFYNALSGAALALLMVSVSLGFLFFNLPPAKLFMGNSGSHFVGAAIAFSPLTAGGSASPALLLPAAVLMLVFPLLDLTWSFWRRLIIDHNPFGKDKRHLYHIVRAVIDSGGQTIVFFSIIFITSLSLAVIGTRFAPTEQILLLIFQVLLQIVLFAVIIRRHHRLSMPEPPDEHPRG